MGLDFRFEGVASLMHIHHPSLEDGRLVHDEYFARMKVAIPSIAGRSNPIIYDLPLTKDQYDALSSEVNDPSFRDPAIDAERGTSYKKSPCIKAECRVTINSQRGEPHH